MKTTDKYYTLKITQDKKQLSLFLAYFHESTDMQQKTQQQILVNSILIRYHYKIKQLKSSFLSTKLLL